MRSGLRWFDGIFLAVLLYLFVAQIAAVWPFTIDDMYISLRYAKNWASGIGLLWNADAPPVEGYSNFSYVVLATLSLLIHINPVITLKIAGIIGLLFAGIFVFLISRFWFTARLALIPWIFLFLYCGEPIWAVSGLETTVYQALICGAVYFIFCGLGYRPYPNPRGAVNLPSFILAGVFLALAGMTRPETPAFMLIFFILICLDKPQTGVREYWKGVGFFCATLVFLFAPYFLWRWHYYGYLFPNTVYCKGFVKDSFYLDLKYLKLIWPFALLAIPACIYAPDRRHYFLWLPSIVYLVLLADSDPLVAYFNRLFLPAFALILPLVLQGISVLVLWYLKQKNEVYTAALFILSVVFATIFIPKMSLSEYRYYARNPIMGEATRMDIIQWLNAHAKADDTVVLGDAGLIPYHSKLRFIDSYCLNNLTMAHDSKTQRHENFCKQIIKQKPQIIILTSLLDENGLLYHPSDSCLKKDLKENSHYKRVKFLSIGQPPRTYRYEVYRYF